MEGMKVKYIDEIDLNQKETNETEAEIQETIKEVSKDINEVDETDERVGYSSDYYKWEMANAIKNGNSIALKYAKKNYAEAKVREATK